MKPIDCQSVFETQSEKLQLLMAWISNHKHKIEESQQKVPSLSPKLLALNWKTCGNFQHCCQWTNSKEYGWIPLHWRHNGRDCVSSHQPQDCLLKRLFGRRSKETSKLRVTGLCAGNSPGPVNSPHKWPITWKMFPFDDVIMTSHVSCEEVYTIMWIFYGQHFWTAGIILGYRLSQWETMLHCNAVPHWLSPYPELFLEPRNCMQAIMAHTLSLLFLQIQAWDYHMHMMFGNKTTNQYLYFKANSQITRVKVEGLQTEKVHDWWINPKNNL